MTEIEAEIQPGPSYFSDFGGMLAVPFEKRAQFRAGAYALLGEYGAAEQMAQRSLEVYESNPPANRAYGNEADCRITIAVARLAKNALESSVQAVEPVLALPRDERARWFIDRLVDYGSALRQHKQYGSSSLASIVSEQISEFGTDTAELPAGNETP